MFSHTQSLDQQAQKLTSTSTEQPAEVQQVEQIETVPEQSEPHESDGSADTEPAEQSAEPSTDPIAEAEQRGFQRAMALRVEELFNRPTSGTPTFPKPDPDEAAASDIVFLSRVRRSVWD
ncbi:MAG: hypothetical protein K2N08_05920 [Muribaculaceae bacterium]|nr:hypothetical protein [Muribaculaceae bacterium]